MDIVGDGNLLMHQNRITVVNTVDVCNNHKTEPRTHLLAEVDKHDVDTMRPLYLNLPTFVTID